MSTFRSFRYREFRRWFVGQSISQIGYWFFLVAQSLYVLELTDSGGKVGLVSAMQYLPLLLFGLYAGVLTDRLDVRLVLITTQSILMATSLMLGVLVLTGAATFGWVLVLATVGGIAWAFDQPGRRTIATELVPDDAVTNAVSLSGALNQVARLLGPLLAAGLMAVADIGWCFVVNGVSSIGVILALAVTPTRRQPGASARTAGPGQIREAGRHLWRHRDLRLALSLLLWTSVLAFNWNVLFPLFAVRDLDGSTTTYATLMAAMSVGSILGALWLARQTSAGSKLLSAGSCIYGMSVLAMSVAPSVVVAAVLAAAAGVGSTLVVNGGTANLQLGADRAMRGRAMAFFSVALLGGLGVGGPLAGSVAQHLGARFALAASALAALSGGAVGLALTARQAGTAVTRPLREARAGRRRWPVAGRR